MLDMLNIRADEPRGVRLFSVAADRATLDRFQAILAEAEPGLSKGYLADCLGVEAVDATRVEVFHLDDLSNFGLFNYLVKANGLPEAALEPDRQAIDAVSGVVMMIYSGAFRDVEVTLNPTAMLNPIGAWDEDLPDIEFTPLRADTATGDVADIAPTPTGEPIKTPRWIWWVTAAFLLTGGIAMIAALSGGS